MTNRILAVDDEPDMCELIEVDLRRRGLDVTTTCSPQQALDWLQKEDFDLILADLNMPGIDGLELCRQVVANRQDVPVIVITGFGSLESAVAAIRAGAFDFVTKPVEMDLLAIAVERALNHRDLKKQIRVLAESLAAGSQLGELMGSSRPMRRLFDQISRVADSEASVLITGESGTGKELVAKALHRNSSRSQGPFVAINCAALPSELLESELFGHEKGAFTDARTFRKGLFLQSDGGTLFLDEIGDFPLSLQPKLLRALEQRSFRPLGSDQEVKFDARIVTATHRDLEAAVRDGQFRQDLYFRINVIELEVPPLRERGNDILLLAQHFVKTFASRSGKPIEGFSEAVAAKLLSYSWPGNVRELKNAMERAVALSQLNQIGVEVLPDRVKQAQGTSLIVIGEDSAELVPMTEIERRYILHVLKAVDANRTAAARILGFDRKTLYRKLKSYGVEE